MITMPLPLGMPMIRIQNTEIPVSRWFYEPVLRVYPRNTLVAFASLARSNMWHDRQFGAEQVRLNIELDRDVVLGEKFEILFPETEDGKPRKGWMVGPAQL